MVVADGTGIRLACSTHSAERAEVKLAAETVDQAYYPEAPTPLSADKSTTVMNSEMNWQRKTYCSFLRIDRIANAALVRMAEGYVDTRADRSSKERFPGSGNFAGWLCAMNTTVKFTKLLYT
jgi:hypothetical protein